MRTCTKCGLQKLAGEFHAARKARDGLRHRCKACVSAYHAKRYLQRKEKILRQNAIWALQNPDKSRARGRAWRREHKSVALIWAKNNPEKIAQIATRYQRRHPEKIAALRGRRRAYQLRATPAWANQGFIEDVYRKAAIFTKRDGIPWHVDHIVPLKSPFVCGLHCEDNLEAIPGKDNVTKSNRHWPDMPRQEVSCVQ